VTAISGAGNALWCRVLIEFPSCRRAGTDAVLSLVMSFTSKFSGTKNVALYGGIFRYNIYTNALGCCLRLSKDQRSLLTSCESDRTS
jgi:hypothetical protein